MSAALLERSAQPCAAPPILRGIPVRAVEQVRAPADLGHFFGLQLIQTHAALCHPEIEAGDCIEVDFDRRDIHHDGLYIISIRHDDGCEWRGARRFQFRLNGQLWVADPDGHVGVTWRTVTPTMLNSLTVYGVVREVFKPASKLRKAAP